jgi:hypothetical protein
MIVTIAGVTRTWEPLPFTIAECPFCGARAFRRSKLTKHWHCKECNETFENEKPWWNVIECSAHGQQLQQANGEQSYWCIDCEADDFPHAHRQPSTAHPPSTPDATKQPASALPPPTRATPRISTSIKIDDELWREVKHHCVEAHLTIADYLEQVIRNELRK